MAARWPQNTSPSRTHHYLPLARYFLNCGPGVGPCPGTFCCSKYMWCGRTLGHCAASSCLQVSRTPCFASAPHPDAAQCEPFVAPLSGLWHVQRVHSIRYQLPQSFGKPGEGRTRGWGRGMAVSEGGGWCSCSSRCTFPRLDSIPYVITGAVALCCRGCAVSD